MELCFFEFLPFILALIVSFCIYRKAINIKLMPIDMRSWVNSCRGKNLVIYISNARIKLIGILGNLKGDAADIIATTNSFGINDIRILVA